MKDLRELDRYRQPHMERHLYGSNDDPTVQGVFVVMYRSATLRVIASNGGGWDHVSVSTATRCPTWEEMERVKRLFFEDHETAMQLHVPPSEHRNCHPYCLHLWRPQHVDIPRLDSLMVAP